MPTGVPLACWWAFVRPPHLTPLWGVQIGLNRIKQTYLTLINKKHYKFISP